MYFEIVCGGSSIIETEMRRFFLPAFQYFYTEECCVSGRIIINKANLALGVIVSNRCEHRMPDDPAKN